MNTISKYIPLMPALVVTLGLATVSRAGIYSVTNTNSSGSGSLAQALSQEQSDTNATINMLPGLGVIQLNGSLPAIQNNLVINGNGNGINGKGSYRPFFVNASNCTVQINALTLANGLAQGGDGGLGHGGGGGGAGLGGAIFLNAGTLTVSNVNFANNTAVGGNGSPGFNGATTGAFGGGGGGGGLNFAGGAGGTAAATYAPGGGGGALTSAGAAGDPIASRAGMGGGVNGALGGLLELAGSVSNGLSATLPDGGGGGGGLSLNGGDGGNGGNGSDFSGGGGAGGSQDFISDYGGNGGFGGGGGGGANAFMDADGGGNGGFGGGGGGGGLGGEAGGSGGTGGFGGGTGAPGTSGNGGGGLGAGGAIFARAGAIITVQDCTFNDNLVLSGLAGGSSATAGGASGQALFLGASVNYSVSSGTNTLIDNIGGGNDANARGWFYKTGAGKLVLESPESYFGSTIISNGTLESVNNQLPSTAVTISSNAVLEYNYSGRILGSGVTYTGTGTLRTDGPGNVVFGPGVTYVDFSPGAWIDVESGLLTGSSSYGGVWANNYASLNIASNATFDAVEAGLASAMQIDALSGAGTFQGGYSGNPNGGLTTLTIGITNGSGTFNGKFQNDINARLGIIKTGTGTEIFTGTNSTYSGNTVVKNGTLVINGTAGTGSVTVSNGILAGIGSIAGPVLVTTNGTLAPGWPTGTLTMTNTLNLAGNTLITVNSGANSRVTGLASVTYGGTLTVNNIGGTLHAGDTFSLFNASSWSGNFATVTGSGLSLSFNPTNGVLTILAILPTAPTNIYYTARPGSFTVNWPTNYTGWILQAQTNSYPQGLSTNWVDVPGSAAVDTMTFSMSRTNSVFFRLRLP